MICSIVIRQSDNLSSLGFKIVFEKVIKTQVYKIQKPVLIESVQFAFSDDTDGIPR